MVNTNGGTPTPSIPSAKAFGTTFNIMLYAPLTSAVILMPLLLLNTYFVNFTIYKYYVKSKKNTIRCYIIL